MHESSAKIEFSTEQAEIYYNALAPEGGVLPGRRTKAKITIKDNKLILSIEAKDITAMRAAVNSFIRWYIAVMRCIGEVMGDGH